MYSSRYSSSSDGSWKVYLIAFVIVFLGYWITAGLVPESKAINAAQDVGYTDVKIEDTSIVFVELRGCDKSDTKMWRMSGTNVRGERRHFIVCASLLKGGTVRSTN